METNLLDTFLMVADAGGLSAAASMLSIPQSIVSRRIKELEMHCHAPLFYRHGRGVKLTPAGETLYQSARPLVEQIQSVIGSVAEQATSASGVVSVVITPALMSIIGVRLLEEVEKQFPNIRIQLAGTSSRYVLEWLLQGRVDIGVLSDIGLSTQVHADELGSTRVTLTARHDSPFLTREMCSHPLDFGALREIPLVVPTRGLGLRRSIDLAAAKAGVALNIAYEVDDIDLSKELVGTGRVATLLTRLATRKELAQGYFIEAQVRAAGMLVPTILATALNRPISPAMKAVIPILKKVAGVALVEYG